MGGISSDPPSADDPKHHQFVTGYPSTQDHRYQTYPPATSFYPAQCHPQPYTTSPYPQIQYPPPPPPPYQQQPYPPTNPYPQPYNDYYYQQHYKRLEPDSSSSASSFGRVMLMLMLVLIASMCMMSLVMWFLFGTYIPQFQVVSIKITNFTATNTSLTGIWNVDLSVSNINKELDVKFDHGMSSIFFDDALLGISTFQAFDVKKLQRFDLKYSMAAEQKSEEHLLPNWVLPALSEDLSNKIVSFSLRLGVQANFTAPDIVYRQETLKILCEDLQISFSENGEGTLSPGFENTCLIRLNDGVD